MKIDLDEIERKARAAEQSRWTTLDAPGRMPEYCSGFAIVKADGGEQIADAFDGVMAPDAQCHANAQHIAAASPPVVLALLARNRELEGGLRDACDHIDDLHLPDPGLRAESARLRAMLAKGVVLP